MDRMLTDNPASEFERLFLSLRIVANTCFEKNCMPCACDFMAGYLSLSFSDGKRVVSLRVFEDGSALFSAFSNWERLGEFAIGRLADSVDEVIESVAQIIDKGVKFSEISLMRCPVIVSGK